MLLALPLARAGPGERRRSKLKAVISRLLRVTNFVNLPGRSAFDVAGAAIICAGALIVVGSVSAGRSPRVGDTGGRADVA